MGDQLIPENWAAYINDLKHKHFASGKVDPPFPNMTPSFNGVPRPWVVIMPDLKSGAVESFQLDAGNEFEQAKMIWESNGKPRLWLFWDLASAPWRCTANS